MTFGSHEGIQFDLKIEELTDLYEVSQAMLLFTDDWSRKECKHDRCKSNRNTVLHSTISECRSVSMLLYF